MLPESQDIQAAERLTEAYGVIRKELSKQIIGMDRVIDEMLICIFSRGHCLLVGVPGLAKTLLISSLAEALSLSFARIQFTPDLMPADITGTEVIQEDKAAGTRAFKFLKGPVFANVILADEINRTPPKTQAALLEAMQEHQVTAAGVRHALPEPFFVLATQNPIEMEGTYPLPEAQLDRFMFNVNVDYLAEDDEVAVVKQTTATDAEPIEPLYSAEEVQRFHEVVKRVPIAEDLIRFVVRVAAASRPRRAGTPEFVNEWISWGAGLRASQYLVLGAKARALLQGRAHVTRDDIDALAHPTFRHRILINYRAEAEGVTVEKVIDRLIDAVSNTE